MEIWKKIEKFDNQYEVSNLGRIRSVDAVIIRSNGRKHTRVSKILKPNNNYNGYSLGAVCVNKKMVSYKLHRLVAEAFIPNPDGKEEVNHKNGIKHDNRVENLEWVTRSENIKHSIENNLQVAFKGEDVGTSILKEKDVLEIRSKYKPHIYTRRILAEEYGVSEATIKDIVNNRTWKHLL